MAGTEKGSLRLEKGPWRLEVRTTAASLLILMLLGLLSWLCLSQTTKVTTTEYRIRQNKGKIACLQEKNAELLTEVVEMLSISRLESRALGLGYVFAEERRYLDVPGYPGGVSRGGLATASSMGESAIVTLEEPRDESSSVVRWWEKVVSQFATWAGKQP